MIDQDSLQYVHRIQHVKQEVDAATGTQPWEQVIAGTNIKVTELANGAAIRLDVGTKYKARATRGMNFTLTHGAFTKVEWATESYDLNSNYDNTVNYNYTVPVTGYYQVSATCPVSGNGETLLVAIVAIFVDAVEKSRGSRLTVTTGLQSDVGLEVNDILSLIATQTVDIRVYATTSLGGAPIISGGNELNHFAIHLLSID